ncbi:hypothetical protein L873DRAFT_1761793 [Choiromyces venosus 120613-1]|uniref:PiggyBac transposable element-derived protein domain-containing protein n=1 Tax=Choiromyces venosus 120613-1 TaxID=1336337 RepID=A0A3N4JX31_9PEZI|nr:hypothetical protein L873DRAFT_1761793 [Choiromyces venosus 120613-1]
MFSIPVIIDNYSHNMNGVNLADQLCASYPTQLTSLHNWLPLFFWILDTSVINSFILYCLSHPNAKHHQFHLDLLTALFKDSKKKPKPRIQTTYKKKTTRQYRPKYQTSLPPLASRPHILIHLPATKHSCCIFCHFLEKKILSHTFYLFFLFY